GQWVEYPKKSGRVVKEDSVVDWNENGIPGSVSPFPESKPYPLDLNSDEKFTQLDGYEDWSHLQYGFLDSRSFLSGVTADDPLDEELTFELDQQLSGLITPPNSPGVLELSSSTYSVHENAGSVTVSVVRTDGVVGPVSVRYTTAE